MNAQTKLAPCPFCGNKAVPISVHYPEGQVRCEDSNCFLGYRWSCDQEAWNSRPDLLRIKELEEKVKELELKLQHAQEFCIKRAGHKLMQIAQPFRELVNILK